MIKKIGYRWRLRRIMADHDMYATSDLVDPLAERGVILSREQVFRLVTQAPQRLSMDTLAALCDIFAVTPNDLIEIGMTSVSVPKPAASAAMAAPSTRKVTVKRPGAS